jgi:hypothetical protein
MRRTEPELERSETEAPGQFLGEGRADLPKSGGCIIKRLSDRQRTFAETRGTAESLRRKGELRLVVTFIGTLFDSRTKYSVSCRTSVTYDMITTIEMNSWYAARCSRLQLGGLRRNMSAAQGRLLSTLLASVAEFERELIRERTGEGRKRAMAAGVRFGRKR